MALDHSLTYRKKKLRNLPHQLRLNKILRIVDSFSIKPDSSYLDIGCSNGYITAIIATRFKLMAKGLDHTLENLEIAKKAYPSISFEFIDLNLLPPEPSQKYEIVTCFETLEHVGDLPNAVSNILSFGQTGTKILMSVPIEIGIVGLMKFLVKTTIFRYQLDELSGSPSWAEYARTLMGKNTISIYRDKRPGWGTHFGFDYREVDKILIDKNVNFKAFNSFSTRFYEVTL
ncbi:MAG: class I SAM-dependent methyltransferase [Bacteroidota bacterium]